MRRANRGVALTTGNTPAALERSFAVPGKRKGRVRHAGLRPKKRATDLYDVYCACGWSSLNHESRGEADRAAAAHRSASKKPVTGGEGAARRKKAAAARARKTNRAPKQPKAVADPPTRRPMGDIVSSGKARPASRARVGQKP